MKKLIPLLFFVYTLNAQKDTIFKDTGDRIICTITFVNNNNIFYDTKKSSGEMISVKNVATYSQNGKRVDPKVAVKVAGIKDNSVIAKKPGTETVENSYVTKKQMEYLTNCLYKCHKEFVGGAITCLAGTLITYTGILLSSNNIGTNNNNTPNTVITLTGSGITLIGGIIMIDSHKWIGKASFALDANKASVIIPF